jgi:hypothetical protein
MKLIAVITHDNYYSQFHHPSCELKWGVVTGIALPFSYLKIYNFYLKHFSKAYAKCLTQHNG